MGQLLVRLVKTEAVTSVPGHKWVTPSCEFPRWPGRPTFTQSLWITYTSHMCQTCGGKRSWVVGALLPLSCFKGLRGWSPIPLGWVLAAHWHGSEGLRCLNSCKSRTNPQCRAPVPSMGCQQWLWGWEVEVTYLGLSHVAKIHQAEIAQPTPHCHLFSPMCFPLRFLNA